MKSIYCVILLALTSYVHGGDAAAEIPKVAKDFEVLKPLVGRWEGTTKMDDKMVPVVLTYELTSGGSALMERLFVGTPHEMVSVYYSKGDKVEMTHYCMMGNQPQLSLKKVDGKTMVFEMEGTNGIKSASEPHMHQLNITLIDKDHIQQEWTCFDEGKKKENTIIKLERKI
jgi:hypothetical protein